MQQFMLVKMQAKVGKNVSSSVSLTSLLGLVTRTIAPRSSEFHSAKGKAAIEEEIADLRKDQTWDESSVRE